MTLYSIIAGIFLISSIRTICSVSAQTAPLRILIGSPVRKKPVILREFLDSLLRLERDNIITDYFFVDDNDDPESTALLQEFARNTTTSCTIYRHPQKTEAYVCTENTHYWTSNLIARVTKSKNMMIEAALKGNYDYLFLVDSDLVLHTKTLFYLVKAGKDIIAENHWTRWFAGSALQPSVWQEHDYNYNEEFLQKLRHPGVYPVKGLCACTLVSRRALQLGVSFDRLEGVEYTGEDRHFCLRAEALGLRLFCDTHAPAFHIYRDSEVASISRHIRRTEPDIYATVYSLSKTHCKILQCKTILLPE